MNMKNTQKYVLTFAQDDKGNDIKYRFMISLGKTIKSTEQRFLAAVMETDGVDHFEVRGRYTAEVSISRAFDADEVLAELTPKIEAAISDIIVSKLVV